MSQHRKQAEEFCYKLLNMISPGTEMVKVYKEKFSNMTDDEFDKELEAFERGEKFLCIISPNAGHHDLSLERNYEVGDAIGHNFYQKLWIGESDDVPGYLTPIEHLVFHTPIRRASQLLTKKRKVPANNNTIDHLTGGPTGASASARISYHELKILETLDVAEPILEVIKFRGGDTRAFNISNALAFRFGEIDQNTLQQFSGGVKSTQTLRSYLNAAHFKTTL